MRAYDVFMQSLVANNATAIFGNPGTTENPLLDSLIDYPNLRYFKFLHEAIAVSAAGYYAQASGNTGIANVHVAPGLGNTIGTMYGALKACLPIIVTAGQQDTRMRLRAPILHHDLVAMAKPVSKWAVEVTTADEISDVMSRAFAIANEHPKGPVFVSLPNNVMEQDTDIGPRPKIFTPQALKPNETDIEALAEMLAKAQNPAFFAGDDIAGYFAVDEFEQIVELVGAAVYTEVLRARQPLRASHPNLGRRIPYTAGGLRDLLKDHDLLVMIGGPFVEEVWFDDVDAKPPHTKVVQLEISNARISPNLPPDVYIVGDLKASMAALKLRLQNLPTAVQSKVKQRNEQHAARKAAGLARWRNAASEKNGLMTVGAALDTIAQTLSDDAIVVDEAITAAVDLEHAFQPGPEEFYASRGGGIGQGIAGALGVALAKPEKRVIVVSGDGSAMYSATAFWTAASYQLKVMFVIVANREYGILKHNLDEHRRRFGSNQDKPYPEMDLDNPIIDFVGLASSLGVPARKSNNLVELSSALAEAAQHDGPFLLELVVEPK